MFNINHILLEISGLIQIPSVIVTSHITVTILTPVLEIGSFVTSLQRIMTKKYPFAIPVTEYCHQLLPAQQSSIQQLIARWQQKPSRQIQPKTDRPYLAVPAAEADYEESVSDALLLAVESDVLNLLHLDVFVPKYITPLPSNRHHRSSGDCLEGKGGNYQVCSVQYCVQQLCTVRSTHI